MKGALLCGCGERMISQREFVLKYDSGIVLSAVNMVEDVKADLRSDRCSEDDRYAPLQPHVPVNLVDALS